ncbi:MAG: polyamine aminopropyltransferase [Pseudobdellovibrionaceae bacterium]
MDKNYARVLLFSAFVVATCGLIYELIAGALASYLLGDSVTQFSTIIGTYLFAMGIGSYLSKFFHRNLLSVFVRVEILVGLVGGCSAAILFVLFDHVASFRVLLYSLVSITGILVGLEIPLLLRILKDELEFNDLVSKVLSLDYIGALIASLLFPLVLVPYLGLVRSGFMFGIINVLIAVWSLVVLKKDNTHFRFLKTSAILAAIFLTFGFVFSEKIVSFSEVQNYHENVIYSKNTKYQRLVITRSSLDLRLYLNGNLQFSSFDEYRYHESLVHPGLAAMIEKNPAKDSLRLLILGGGDGLAAREALKYPEIHSITLVDLDSQMTQLFSQNELLLDLNKNSMNDSRVSIVNDDAFQWVKKYGEDALKPKFDFVVIDLPDPSNFSIGKLYSNSFYRALRKILHRESFLVVQGTSPLIAKRSFWILNETIKSTGLKTFPYHVYVPSFGEWGFVLASTQDYEPPKRFPADLKYLDTNLVTNLFEFPKDMISVETDVNKLNNQILVRVFEQEWANYSNQ